MNQKKTGFFISLQEIYKANNNITPCFNPNNSAKFLYVKDISNHSEIHVFDIKTKQDKLIFSNDTIHIGGQPYWSKKDWIIFFANKKEVFKVKSDGTSLTKLLSNNEKYYFINPIWNSLGTKFLVSRRKINNNEIEYNYCLYDENGNIEDTLIGTNITNDVFDWQNDKLIYMRYKGNSYKQELVLLNNFTSEVVVLNSAEVKYNSTYLLSDAKFSSDGKQMFWTVEEGALYKTDLSTKISTQLTDNCNRNYYYRISISNDGNYIVGEHINTSLNEEAVLYSKNIYLYDLRTEIETQITFD